jgi:hypothetical protein
MLRKTIIALLAVASVGLASPTMALARGGGGHGSAGGGMGHSMGMGMAGMPVTGGALGTSAATPGTNSLGTALASSGHGIGPQKGPALGTGSPAVDRDEAQVAKALRSICTGC